MSTAVEIDRRDMIAGLGKGLAVLELLSAQRPRLTIADAAAGAGLSRAAARRVLLTLAAAGYLEFDGKFFTATRRVLRLSQGFAFGGSLPERLQPVLDRISRETGESASAAILDGVEIVYIARAATRRIMSIGLGVGSRLMDALLVLARKRGVRRIIADVLRENTAMRALINRYRAVIQPSGDPVVVRYRVDV